MAGQHILLVEDDSELLEMVRRALEREDFAVTGRATGADALSAVERVEPDAIVLDIGLPDSDGRDVCQALRARGVDAPVLFLTARDAVTDRLAGFSAGGDDYLVKPFDVNELVARLRALLRRSGADGPVSVAGLELDPVGYSASGGGSSVPLTPTEFRLLSALAARQGGAVRRRELRETAWPHGGIVHDNTLDVHIARLRSKLRELPGAPEIATVHGVGYSLR
ncbi:MAG: response regulator transcription factor [Thermoleophilaceae bacterium]